MNSSSSRSARENVPFGVRLAAAWSGYWLVIAAGVVVCLWVLAKLGIVTVAMVAGIMIAAFLQPLAGWMARKGVPRGLAALSAFFVGLGGFAVLIWFVVAQVMASSGDLSHRVTKAENSTRKWLVTGPLHVDGSTADDYTIHLSDTISSHMGGLSSQLASGAGMAMSVFSGVLVTLFCLLFLLADDGSIYRWCVGILPKSAQSYAEVAGAAAWQTLVVYMRSLVLLALINALAMLPIMWLAHVPLVLPLTVALFLGSLIPMIGVLIAGALLFVVALIANGMVTAIVMMVALLLVIQLFGNLLNPIILGKFVNLHPIVILLGVTGGTLLGGAFGAFVAVPVIAVINNAVKAIRAEQNSAATVLDGTS